MADTIIPSGGTVTVSGAQVTNNNRLLVWSGGTAYNTRITGGSVFVGSTGTSGGVASGVSLTAGAMSIQSGGRAFVVDIIAGTLSFGDKGSAYGVNVSAGGKIVVSTGCYVSGLKISAGGVMQVAQQGWTEFRNVDITGDSNNNTNFNFYGLVDTLTASKANIGLYGSGTNITLVNSSASVWLNTGAKASGVTVKNGASAVVGNSGTIFTAILSGGTLKVDNTGIASGVVISGGTATVSRGGTAYNVSAFTDGSALVSSGAMLSGLLVAGGRAEVASGGTVYNTTLSGGTFAVGSVELSGGVASGANVKGGTMGVRNGGQAYGVDVSSGGTVSVLSGGVVSSINISGNGILNTSSGARVSGLALYNGLANLNGGVVSGAVLSGTAIAMVSGTQGRMNVRSGATVIDTVVSYGGLLRFESGGGTASGVTTVHSGGLVDVSGSGTIAALNLVTTSNYDFGIGTALTYTINGNALIDDKYFSGYTVYVLDRINLAVTVGASTDYCTKMITKNSELVKIATDDGVNTYAGALSNTYIDVNDAFFAAKGNAATADRVILCYNGAAASKAVCGGGSAGAVIAAELEVKVTGGSANFVYGGGQSFNTNATTVDVVAGGTVGTVYGGANLTSGNGANVLGTTTLNIAGQLTGSAFGGNRVTSGAVVSGGDVTVNVSSGAMIGGNSFVFGAGFVINGGTLNVTDVAVNWDGGIQSGTVTNGRGLVAGGIAGTDATLNITTTTADITSGSVYYVYGGVWAQNQATGHVDTANITITGGDHGVVYGGGIALGVNTVSTVENVNITISGATKISSLLTGGLQSSHASTITGAAQVTLCDTASVKKFINGEGASCTITLDDFSGSFSGLAGFGKVEVKGATAVAQEFQMIGAATSTWNFDLGNESGALMTWKGNSSNNFNGDAIALTFDTTDTSKSWTLVSVNGSRGEDLLDLTGAAITYNNGSTTDWELTRQGEDESWSLVLAHKS
ncbi:MAG: hypothetical protein PHI35_05095 [Victivallaceae bacterium]|nr:hypothetical protein [Victivallaceae bacterium]